MNAYLFPGQGAQFPGMGKALYDSSTAAQQLFATANQLLGFPITEVMFEGTHEALRPTKIAQLAIFLHSVILAKTTPHFNPHMVAGHSLGEFSALVASEVLSFETGLQLVAERALAMQAACEARPATMAAILGLADDQVAQLCASIHETVVPANYNCPGQVVMAGSLKGIEQATEIMKKAGAKKVVALNVSGAFHSPFMQPAKARLAKAIQQATFSKGLCPVYQNVNALPTTSPHTMQANLIAQLTAPVRWTDTVQHMIRDGATHCIECGPGKVLQGLVKKIHPHVTITGL